MSSFKTEKWFLLRVGLPTLVVIAAKMVAHLLGWEAITVNTLFSGIVAANVFLMGFLLSGVLVDFKEAEKIPGEIAACLENLAQEIRGAAIGKPEVGVGPALAAVSRLGDDIVSWFYKRVDTASLIDQLDNLTVEFSELTPRTDLAYITRCRQEQSNLRRTVVRAETIRDTSFVAAGYLLVNTITVLLCVGLALSNLDPFYESLFSIGVISFLLIFLMALIHDLDNPFAYYDRFSGTDVSLAPLHATVARLALLAGVRKGQRFRVREDMDVLYVTHWKTDFSGGGKGRIPAGTMVTVEASPDPGATVAACLPDDPALLEAALVPADERADEKYAGFSLSLDLDALRSRCELAL